MGLIMTTRITEKDLQALCDEINRKASTPMQPYNGSKSNDGNYHIAFAYGGVALHQMRAHGIRDICGGYWPKRELYRRMLAFTP